ncbi:alanine racemase [candidate division KSB1 bacterium]|nr:MAG: alanine racemase [candidate division KSB1 bacterium]
MRKIKRRDFIYGAGLLSASFPLFRNILNNGSILRYNSNCDPWLEINLSNIEWNVNQLRKWVRNKPIMAVIKGNAYGHGLVKVGKFLEKIKIYALAVGKLQEAIELRRNGVKCPVLNFGPFSEEDTELIIRSNISQTVYSDNVLALNKMAKKLNTQANVHINIDTGLGRVGVPHYTALSFIENVSKLDYIKIEGVFTVFTEEKNFDRIQLDRFLRICNDAKRKGISVGLRHVASSAGLLGFPESHLDMVRPGICIYGHYPSDEEYKLKKIELKPALSLKTRVSYIKKLRPGDSISYHRKFVAKKEETVVTASLGYSDGFPVNVIGKANAIIKNEKFPLIAAVTANHISIKVTGKDNIKIGDEVVLIGSQGDCRISAEELAEASDTSVYKVIIWLNPLLPRYYI